MQFKYSKNKNLDHFKYFQGYEVRQDLKYEISTFVQSFLFKYEKKIIEKYTTQNLLLQL